MANGVGPENLMVGDGSIGHALHQGTARGVIPPVRLGFRVVDIGRIELFGGFTILQSAELLVNSAEDILIGGDFDHRGIGPACFDWTEGGIELVSLSGQRFEAAGRDLGLTQAGFGTGEDTNFSMGRIEAGPLSVVTISNHFANTAGLGPCIEAVYVRDLTLRAGSNLTLDNARVYYRSIIDEGATITPQGCGGLFAIPGCTDAQSCSDGDACTADSCSGGDCSYSAIPALGYGDVFYTGEGSVVDVDDILCMLDAFQGMNVCPLERTDLFPCGGAPICWDDTDCAGLGVPCTNGRCYLIDVDDLLAELDAFSGIFACSDPCVP